MTQGVESLLGLPRSLEGATARALELALAETWRITTGSNPTDLESDLRLCRRWFDPVAQGQRLRRELHALPVLPPDLQDPGEPLVLVVGRGKRLVTPEGRCVLDLLASFPPEQQRYVVTDSRLVAYDRLLGTVYRDWSRHRIRSVLDLLAGTTKPLQVPAAGVVLALLVNRCTSEERALVRSASDSRRNVIDRAFFTAVNAFADIIAPSRRGQRDQRLISGWMLYEARRRLGDRIVVIDARSGQDGRVWLRAESEGEVIEIVARDLVRGHRTRPSLLKYEQAFDALVDALRAELPRLAGFGMTHERPANTRRLRQQFIEVLAAYIGRDDDTGPLDI